MLMPRNTAPRGLPRWRRVCWLALSDGLSAMEVLSRNSWVMATPMEAKASDVRSHARNVRSAGRSRKQFCA